MTMDNSAAGGFATLITSEDVKLEGTVSYADASILILENVFCYGSEGRKKNPSKEIPACNQVVGCVQIRHQDCKDTELIYPHPHEVRATEYPPLSRLHVHRVLPTFPPGPQQNP